MIHHRPPHDILVDYATGALAQPLAMAVATHAELCPESLAEIADIEAVGGVMLASLEPVKMSENALDRVMALVGEMDNRIPDTEIDAGPDISMRDEIRKSALPPAIRATLDGKTDTIAWQRRGPVIESTVLDCDLDNYEVRLFRIKAGKTVPQHTHEGLEITVCLTGGYTDGRDRYARGDFQVADPMVNHQPVADNDEHCIVLTVFEKDIRLTSPLGRLINPFVRL
ncbi:MAG: ChrR family anti-sigma-E factor [Rhodospirillaceae bacterium]|nr:ChrR family anti-sigma-E factor [Rhodospirillaceae bacterium]